MVKGAIEICTLPRHMVFIAKFVQFGSALVDSYPFIRWHRGVGINTFSVFINGNKVIGL